MGHAGLAVAEADQPTFVELKMSARSTELAAEASSRSHADLSDIIKSVSMLNNGRPSKMCEPLGSEDQTPAGRSPLNDEMEMEEEPVVRSSTALEDDFDRLPAIVDGKTGRKQKGWSIVRSIFNSSGKKAVSAMSSLRRLSMTRRVSLAPLVDTSFCRSLEYTALNFYSEHVHRQNTKASPEFSRSLSSLRSLSPKGSSRLSPRSSTFQTDWLHSKGRLSPKGNSLKQLPVLERTPSEPSCWVYEAGTVWTAFFYHTMAVTAIKVQRGSQGTNTARQLLKQCRGLHSMNHPGFVRLIGCAQSYDKSDIAIVLDDHLRSLRDYMHSQQIMSRVGRYVVPRETAANWTVSLCRAVKYLHESGFGLAHGALCPDVLFVDEHLNLKIGSVGLFATEGQIVRVGDRSEQAMKYSAPELIPDAFSQSDTVGRLTQLSDIYSVGAVIYFFCRGMAPFSSVYNSWNSTESMCNRVLLVPCMEYIRKHQCQSMIRIIKGCMSHEPVQRPTLQGVIEQTQDMIAFLKNKATRGIGGNGNLASVAEDEIQNN
mmetsp:Transcript_14055/g.21877  ORF Transcript_14055/g.21877 Transcript_14055/m.21877 type:complete len:541 (-) Transcript_14055:42-1664(-)